MKQERADAATRELRAALAALEERNAELEEARREAEAANELKSRLLANLSHDIRTPIHSVLGFADLLAQADLAPAHADYLATIRHSAEGLLDLLSGILDLSRIESGHLELECRDADINTLLFDVFDLLAPRAFLKGVEFLVTPVPPARSWVRIDPVRLKQVLVNIAGNAVKFTNTGHVHLSAHSTPRSDGGVGIRFRIEDTGRGIAEPMQPRLFQAFAQGDPAHQDSGAGLGLHIASEIVSLMDGRIEFCSEEGSGSAFWFALEFDPVSNEPVPAVSPGLLSGPRRKALLIDAETATRPIHAELLGHAGVDAESISRPEDAAPDPERHDAVIVHIPARALVDGALPPAAPALARSAAPLIALVHTHGAESSARLRQAGYDCLLFKTPDPAAFRDALDRVLNAVPDTAPEPVPGLRAQDVGARCRILVVDDHPVNLKLIRSDLAASCFEVHTASGSDEALYRAEVEWFDVILMDVHLPDRDGIATAQRLRAELGPNAGTPIVAVTADASLARTGRAIAAGMNDVLIKPVSREALIDCIEALLQEAPPARPVTGELQTFEPAVIDGSEGIHRAAGRPRIARELFKVLCDSLPDSRAAVAQARQALDADAAWSHAHRLRGAVAWCGVPRLEAAVADVERAARAGDRIPLDHALARLERAIDEVLEHAGRAIGRKPEERNG